MVYLSKSQGKPDTRFGVINYTLIHFVLNVFKLFICDVEKCVFVMSLNLELLTMLFIKRVLKKLQNCNFSDKR